MTFAAMPVNQTPTMSIETIALESLRSYALGVSVAFVLTFAALVGVSVLYHRLRARTCNAKLSWSTIESRCRDICETVAKEWPETSAHRGAQFVDALRWRMNLTEELHQLIQTTLDARPVPGSLFDSIEAVKAAAMKCTELERVRNLLDDASVGTAGLKLPSKAGVAERVSMLCNVVKRMKSAISSESQAPAFVWIPNGLERKAADMLCAFATTMAGKMYKAQETRRQSGFDPFSWSRKGAGVIEDLQAALLNHVAKGDPVDVALFVAFLWHHEEETSLMGYVSLTPALERAMRITLTGVDMETLSKLRDSLVYHGVNFGKALSDGPNPLKGYAYSMANRTFELGRMDSHTLHEFLDVVNKDGDFKLSVDPASNPSEQ